MVFVYMGIAVVVIFLFLVLFYHRKSILKKLKKKEKQKPEKNKEQIEEKTGGDENVEINDFSNPTVKEFDDVDQVLTSEDDISQKTNLENIDDIDFRYDMLERAKENLKEEDEVAPEGPDGSFREMMRQRISIGSHSLTNERPSVHGDDDYDEIINDYGFAQQSESFAKRFADLPPDMKALMMADILNRKY